MGRSTSCDRRPPASVPLMSIFPSKSELKHSNTTRSTAITSTQIKDSERHRNTNTHVQVASVRIPQRVRSMSFTSDGECLVTCGDGHVKFWKMPVGGEYTKSTRGGGRKGIAGGGFLGIGADAIPTTPAATGTANGRVSPRSAEAGGGRRARADEGGQAAGVNSSVTYNTLEGWAATILDEFTDATFVDVSASGKIGGGGGGSGTSAAGAAGGRAAGLDNVFCVTSEGVLCAFTR